MSAIRMFLGCLLLDGLVSLVAAQTRRPPDPSTTLHVNTRLVFLDTTVVDEQGHIVTSGLTRDDFLITEDKQPRRIFSFQPPEQHARHLDDAGGEAPVTIFVVDQLNGSFQDYAFIRSSLQQYLERQPSQLESPCELMLLGHHSLQMVLDFTRSKAELLAALNRIAPPSLLPKHSVDERYNESMYALQLVALQNQGVPGRKNVVWLGYGAPIASPNPDGRAFGKIIHFTHTTTNMLLDARVSLFLIYPGISAFKLEASDAFREADKTARSYGMDNGADPFANEIRFGAFASATGGDLSLRNDIGGQIDRAQALGSGYYTLTYQPQQIPEDARFRSIRVTMRNPNLRAITKTGYFDPDPADVANPISHLMENLRVAVRSTVPLHGLNIRIEDLRWRPDTGTAQFTVVLDEQNLRWKLQDDGLSKANVFFAVVSMKGLDHILTSTYQEVALTKPESSETVRQPIVFHIPSNMTSLRFVIETEDGDRLGNGEISRKQFANAPRTATPQPVLIRRPSR